MKLLAFSFFTLYFLNPSIGQIFTPDPGPVKTQEVSFNLANEVYLYINNPSGDSLRLRWRSLEVNKPDDWTVDLCDYGHCYSGIPSSGLMNWIVGSTQAELKLIVQPHNTPGAAWFWFRVEKNGQPNIFQDVYFNLNTPGTSSVQALAAKDQVSVFPNPARDAFQVINQGQKTERVTIWAADGQLKWEGELAASQELNITSSDWPRGIYFIQNQQHIQKLILQ
jgi:hypothetical protein